MRLSTIFVIVVLIVFYTLVPILVMFFVKDDKKYKFWKNVLLSSFFIVLLIGVIGEIDFNKKSLYIGFSFMGDWFNKNIILAFPKFKTDLVINSIMLMPIGSWVMIESKRKDLKLGIVYSIVLGVITGIMIELLQFILPVNRSVQLSDVVLNTMSAVIGYLYLAGIYWISKLMKLAVSKS